MEVNQFPDQASKCNILPNIIPDSRSQFPPPPPHTMKVWCCITWYSLHLVGGQGFLPLSSCPSPELLLQYLDTYRSGCLKDGHHMAAFHGLRVPRIVNLSVFVCFGNLVIKCQIRLSLLLVCLRQLLGLSLFFIQMLLPVVLCNLVQVDVVTCRNIVWAPGANESVEPLVKRPCAIKLMKVRKLPDWATKGRVPHTRASSAQSLLPSHPI